MTRPRRALIAGNWKMNGQRRSVAELEAMIRSSGGETPDGAELLVCPPATLIAAFADLARGTRVAIGAQDCHPEPAGAFTGDISAEMIADAGARAVIVGHSERRTLHHETDALVRAKVLAAWRAGIPAIACVGGSGAERGLGETLDVVGRQLAGSLPDGATAGTLVIAYEPVWAIGTGLTPTAGDIAAVHGFIRAANRRRFGASGPNIRILYGGSVKATNARELMATEDVDGALVGGASLKADEFLAIAGASK